MKKSPALARLVLTAFLIALAVSGQAQTADFPGVQKAMAPQAYEQAGLSKLTPDERARLDEFIRNYVATSSELASTAAVDQAVKERKVQPPEVIQSNIVGPFRGYNGRSRFTLENGQVWQQSQPVSRSYPLVESPPVLIIKGYGIFGYKMHIAGGGIIRVSKVR